MQFFLLFFFSSFNFLKVIFWSLCSILRTSLSSSFNTSSIYSTTNNVISYTWKSLTLPPLTNTKECSCKLCPSPPIYAFTSLPLVNLTLATFLIAEFGFLRCSGVNSYTYSSSLWTRIKCC